MNIHEIRTEAEYRAALKEASALVDSDPALETPEGKRLNTLVGIVQAYEATYVPVDGALVDSIRAIVAGVEVDFRQTSAARAWPRGHALNITLASTENSVVMGSSVQEKKMHYPVMTEKQVADRWQISLKTLRRWRLDGEGSVWHKLFRHVRYHEADVLEFEHCSAQHLMTLLGIKRDFKPEVPEAAQGLDAKAEDNYFTAKAIAEAASLLIHLFRDQAERNRKRVPHLMLVGNLRFSLPAILEWEMTNSVVGSAAAAVRDEAESPTAPSEPAKRWHEIVREQDAARFDSAP